MVSVEQIQDAIKQARGRQTVNRAILHQNRLKFHAQTSLSANISQPLTDFMAFVSNLIPHDKFKIFKTLFRYPVFTNEVTGTIFDRLSRIFDGRNPAYNYQFKTTEAKEDWEIYRHEKLHEPDVWEYRGFDFYKTEPNAILIVDVAREQKTEYPEPYFYWLSVGDVLAFETKGGKFEYIVFKSKDNTITVLDDATYRVFENVKDNIGTLIVENPHSLGYTPARWFVTEPISIEDYDIKKSPLTKELESLDWLLFFHLSKRHLDLYASYPIYSGYEQSCDFTNSETGDYCDGGFLKNKQGYYLTDTAGVIMKCPKCGDKRIAGVGSFVEVPIPTEGQPDLRNPVQMLTVDKNSLDYNVGEEQRLKGDIITAVCGTEEDTQAKTAINERQVQATFESQTTVLNAVKKQFELAQEFVDETVCRLRYGDTFISASVNYGTEFFIYDVSTLRERYKTAKESGASESELDALQQQIVETEFRHDPTQRQRMMILHELEPYRHLTIAEVGNLYKDGLISAEEYKTKINFAALIRKFERENLNIIEFGAALPYSQKINTIKSTIRNYVNEIQ